MKDVNFCDVHSIIKIKVVDMEVDTDFRYIPAKVSKTWFGLFEKYNEAHWRVSSDYGYSSKYTLDDVLKYIGRHDNTLLNEDHTVAYKPYVRIFLKNGETITNHYDCYDDALSYVYELIEGNSSLSNKLIEL